MIDTVLQIGTFVLLLVLVALTIVLLLRSRKNENVGTQLKLDQFEKSLEKNQAGLRDEFGRNREDYSRSSKEARDDLQKTFSNFSTLIEEKFKGVLELVGKTSKDSRDELGATLKSFESKFTQSVKEFNDLQKQKFDSLILKQEEMTTKTEAKLEKQRENIELKLKAIQDDNNAKLEKMRETVDEKLHKTLETRLGESFKLVSERLELVQKGLGEMQTLATGVGDLKKVLSNVKTKGVLGEYQLENILEQLLTVEQFAKNVKTKRGSNDMVEFAVKIPNKDDSTKILWLPIDAKFPSQNYELLMAAYEAGDVAEIENCKRGLEQTIKSFAKDIKTKYIDPPNTTDFAIMFLPFEGLYAEVLRISGLFENIQREHKITIAGPTTISAFLSSLQMGFRSLAVEKRTSEIWEILGAVRTEFGKFGEVLEKTKNKLDQASREIDNAGVRSRAIERKLRDVQTIPQQDALRILGDSAVEDESDDAEATQI